MKLILVLYCSLVTSEELPYYLVLNSGINPILLTMNIGSRQSITLRALKYPKVCVHLNAFVPDVNINSANDVLQLIADGQLVLNMQPNYIHFDYSAREVLIKVGCDSNTNSEVNRSVALKKSRQKVLRTRKRV